MFKINDYVVYKSDTCHIKDIKTIRGKEYYVLSPINDSSLTINIPLDSDINQIRNVITKDQVNHIISIIPSIKTIKFENEKMFETEYKKLLSRGTYEDLISIIKTAYLRNDARTLNNKKISEKDDLYFKKAEKILYSEFATSLNLSYDDTKKYVFDMVNSLI